MRSSSASRAAYVGGCVGTSNVLAGRRFGIPVKGTHAHSWVTSFPGEAESFAAYARAASPTRRMLALVRLHTAALKVGLIDRETRRSGALAGLRPVLDAAGYVGTLATNSELEFLRYLRPGDELHVTNEVESISARKTTSLGKGYFLTWITTYTCGDEVVGRQLFRIFKFDPSTIDLAKLEAAR